MSGSTLVVSIEPEAIPELLAVLQEIGYVAAPDPRLASTYRTLVVSTTSMLPLLEAMKKSESPPQTRWIYTLPADGVAKLFPVLYDGTRIHGMRIWRSKPLNEALGERGEGFAALQGFVAKVGLQLMRLDLLKPRKLMHLALSVPGVHLLRAREALEEKSEDESPAGPPGPFGKGFLDAWGRV